MKNILHRLDNLVNISLKENIDQRRREDIDRLLLLLPLLLGQPLPIHIRKAKNEEVKAFS